MTGISNFRRGINIFVRIQKFIEVISWIFATVFYFLLIIGFFSAGNLRRELNVFIFSCSMVLFACIFIFGLLLLIIRLVLLVKYELRFFSIENIALIIKLPIFLITAVLIASYILRAAI